MADNPDERFDVVDENDQPVRTARRAEVHARNLLHRAVHILVFHPDDQRLFLQKRSLSKDSHPGKWDSSASGHLDAGESYHHAAVREISEELGIHIPDPRRLAKIPASRHTDFEFVEIFTAQHRGPFQLHPTEISDGQWFSRPQIDQWIARAPNHFAPGFRTVYALLDPKLPPAPNP